MDTIHARYQRAAIALATAYDVDTEIAESPEVACDRSAAAETYRAETLRSALLEFRSATAELHDAVLGELASRG